MSGRVPVPIPAPCRVRMPDYPRTVRLRGFHPGFPAHSGSARPYCRKGRFEAADIPEYPAPQPPCCPAYRNRNHRFPTRRQKWDPSQVPEFRLDGQPANRREMRHTAIASDLSAGRAPPVSPLRNHRKADARSATGISQGVRLQKPSCPARSRSEKPLNYSTIQQNASGRSTRSL